MIDGKLYFAACARPFDEMRDNCLHAAAHAAPKSSEMQRAAALWDCMADFQQRHAYDNVPEFLPQVLRYLGRPIGAQLEPTGCEVGIALDHGRPVVVVGLHGNWFGRTKRGAIRIKRAAVLQAWVLHG